MLQTQSAKSSSSATIQLTGLLAKIHKETKRVELPNTPSALQLIDGQLWCGLYSKIHIYSTKSLHRKRVIELENVGEIGGIAEVDDDMVAVAAETGLVVIDKQGRYASFLYVCFCNE